VWTFIDMLAKHGGVRGLMQRNAAGALAITDRGRAALRAMLPDL
jgi:hypothetical protein